MIFRSRVRSCVQSSHDTNADIASAFRMRITIRPTIVRMRTISLTVVVQVCHADDTVAFRIFARCLSSVWCANANHDVRSCHRQNAPSSSERRSRATTFAMIFRSRVRSCVQSSHDTNADIASAFRMRITIRPTIVRMRIHSLTVVVQVCHADAR